MFKVLFLLGYLSVLDIVQSEPSLIILKNINNVEEPTPSVLTTKSGTNISLTCKIINLKEHNFDNPVVWSKKTKYKFQNKNEEWLKDRIVNKTEPSKLSFIPVKIHDRGTYFCTNTKYNLSKNLQLVVQPPKRKKKTGEGNRWKRAQINYGHGYQWELRTPEPPLAPINVPNPVRDFLDAARKRNKPQVTSDNKFYDWSNLDQRALDRANLRSNSFQYPAWDSNSYNNRYGVNRDQSADRERNDHIYQRSDTASSGKKYYHLIYYVVGFAALVLIIILVCFISHNKEATRAVPVNAIPLPYYPLNPAGRPAETVNSSNQMPETRHDDETDEGTTVLTSLITSAAITANRSTIQADHLDEPPSYDTSIRNPVYRDAPRATMISSCDLPPSYDEAVTNLPPRSYNAPSAPRDVAPDYSASAPPDITRAASHNVARQTPLISRDDV